MPTSNNTVVIENMVDIKQREKKSDDDATLKCANKRKTLKQKVIDMANALNERETIKKRLHNKMANMVKLRATGGSKHWAIADAGATGHFIMKGSPVTNIRPATHPIKIKLPDGKCIMSTHTCNLDIPWLPAHMTEAHIVPGMAHSSLISIKKFCEGGCKVTYDEAEVRVLYKGKVILSGGRCKDTGLWLLPIAEKDEERRTKNTAHAALNLQLPHANAGNTATHMATASVYTLPYKQQQVKYMHQCFFNAPIPTLIKAIQNKQLTGFPCMTVKNIKRYLAPSPATPKGRMKRPRTGIRSTTTQQQREEVQKEEENENKDAAAVNNDRQARHMIPAEQEGNNVFCYAALADKNDGTLIQTQQAHSQCNP